jgi:hypothetical protein
VEVAVARKLQNCVKGCCPRIDGRKVTKAKYEEAMKNYPAIKPGHRNEISETITPCLKEK